MLIYKNFFIKNRKYPKVLLHVYILPVSINIYISIKAQIGLVNVSCLNWDKNVKHKYSDNKLSIDYLVGNYISVRLHVNL